MTENVTACKEMSCDYGCKPVLKGAECYCENGKEYNGTACVGKFIYIY